MPAHLAAARVTLVLMLFGAAIDGQTPGETVARYVDPQQRFEFAYPAAFGTPGRGTDSGYGHRVAAVRFSGLTGLGGEAVLTTGPVYVDIQALGGLYDAMLRDLMPEADWQALAEALSPVTATTFCALLASADHVTARPIPPRLEGIARKVDAIRNVSPVVHRCTLEDDVVVFHKEVTFHAGTASARQHLYGAVRFPGVPYSSFQIVRGSTTAPSASDLGVLERIVRSFAAR